jgi:hypothetical protein
VAGAQDLRDRRGLRARVSTQLVRLQDTFDAMLIDAPAAGSSARRRDRAALDRTHRQARRRRLPDVFRGDRRHSRRQLQIRRASRREPDDDRRPWPDLNLIGGPMLSPFRRRDQALEAEQRWLGEF